MKLDFGEHVQKMAAALAYEIDVSDVTAALLGPGDEVIDVGANVGYHTLQWARRVGTAGRVLAFEPVPPNHEALCKNIALNPELACVEVFNVALGDREAVVRLSDDRHGHTSGGYSARDDDHEGYEVRQTTLDGLIAEGLALRQLRLLKVDVEGWESKVLLGAMDTITEWRPYILIEWHEWHGPNLGEVIYHELLGERGYTPYCVRLSLRGRGYLRRLHDDVSSWPAMADLLLAPCERPLPQSISGAGRKTRERWLRRRTRALAR